MWYAYTGFRLLMALDVRKHAYYIDSNNDRRKFVEGFWNVVNWEYITNLQTRKEEDIFWFLLFFPAFKVLEKIDERRRFSASPLWRSYQYCACWAVHLAS